MVMTSHLHSLPGAIHRKLSWQTACSLQHAIVTVDLLDLEIGFRSKFGSEIDHLGSYAIQIQIRPKILQNFQHLSPRNISNF